MAGMMLGFGKEPGDAPGLESAWDLVSAYLPWLCSHGADASIIDCRGPSVLHRLAYWTLDSEPIDLHLIELLLAYGAPLNHADVNGDTALHLPARNLRQTAAARALIARGATIEMINNKGNTALQEAMRGVLWPKQSWEGGKPGGVTREDRIRAQDEGSIGGSLIGQPNNAGKTPRRLQGETR
ncbi:hypothetical protein BJX63DRAFT_428225 [Aspergillus granulosus]|uniref:Uncharacterized protein n=1 Tax=Aspergillus granulosus TaxID=176169 RepID=A0ABR4HYE2_9EURO